MNKRPAELLGILESVATLTSPLCEGETKAGGVPPPLGRCRCTGRQLCQHGDAVFRLIDGDGKLTVLDLNNEY